MNTCIKCGKPIADGELFCDACSLNPYDFTDTPERAPEVNVPGQLRAPVRQAKKPAAAPAPVKAVIDRAIYASCKYYGDDPHGPALFKGKRLALLTTCGYPVEKGADLYEEMMKRYCKHCGLTYAGMLAERQRNLKEAFMDAAKESHAREFAKALSGAQEMHA